VTRTIFPSPANDDAIRSIKLIVGRLADAIIEGRHGQLDMEGRLQKITREVVKKASMTRRVNMHRLANSLSQRKLRKSAEILLPSSAES